MRVVAEPGVLRVEDTVPGLDDGDREHAFERFYLHERYGRGAAGRDGARARDREGADARDGRERRRRQRPGTLTVFTVRLGLPVGARELPA